MELLYYFLIGAYMLFGLYLFEWAWAQTKAIREVDEARDSKYPAYRRVEAKNWSKWRFYFGAVTWLPARMVLGVSVFVLECLFVK